MKRILSFLIVMAMLLCMIPMAALTVSADTAEHIDLTGKVDYSTYTAEDGTVYTVIRSASAFKNIKNAMKKNYILACDIDFGGETFSTPLTYDGASFSYTMNGNGYAIYNFTVDYKGTYSSTGVLFGKLNAGSKIENLSIGKENAPINYTINGTSVTGAGIIAGMVDSAVTNNDTITISNVDIYSNILFNNAKAENISLGGFVGYTNSAGNVDIINSSFNGSISFSDAAAVSGYNTRVGAFVGYHKGGTLDISGSVNNADIDITNRASLSSGNYAYAGGFVGRSEAVSTYTDCVNNGDILSDKASGGIVSSVTKNTTFTRCVNTGDVTSEFYAGGILAMSYYGAASTQIIEFYDCVNHGDVFANSATDSTRKTRAGGILGVTNSGIYKIDGCGNTGTIAASGVASNILCASGMVGNMGWITDATNSSYVTNCYSTGKIESTLNNDTRTYKTYAIFSGSTKSSAEKIKAANNVWNMTFNGNAVDGGVATNLTDDSGNNKVLNIIAKETPDSIDACIQKSDDNTMLRVLLMTDDQTLDANTDVIIKVYYGNSGKKFTVGADQITALDIVQAAGETYYSVDGQYIFGAVIKGIPEDVMPTITKVTVEYGDYSFDFNMSK